MSQGRPSCPRVPSSWPPASRAAGTCRRSGGALRTSLRAPGTAVPPFSRCPAWLPRSGAPNPAPGWTCPSCRSKGWTLWHRPLGSGWSKSEPRKGRGRGVGTWTPVPPAWPPCPRPRLRPTILSTSRRIQGRGEAGGQGRKAKRRVPDQSGKGSGTPATGSYSGSSILQVSRCTRPFGSVVSRMEEGGSPLPTLLPHPCPGPSHRHAAPCGLPSGAQTGEKPPLRPALGAELDGTQLARGCLHRRLFVKSCLFNVMIWLFYRNCCSRYLRGYHHSFSLTQGLAGRRPGACPLRPRRLVGGRGGCHSAAPGGLPLPNPGPEELRKSCVPQEGSPHSRVS